MSVRPAPTEAERRRAAASFGGASRLAIEREYFGPPPVRSRGRGPGAPLVARLPGDAEFWAIFTIGTVAYLALGAWITLGEHVLFADGAARLTHAYLALWGQPSKLAAIGFIWPPLQTLALLPFAIVPPLATSLAALPLYAAICAGVTLGTLNRTLAHLGLARAWRAGLLGLFALNPMFACYGSNGMAEILYLMLSTLGLHQLVAWQLDGARSYRRLALAGLWMGVAFLSRYELGAWTALMAVWVGAVAWRRRRRWSDFEAPVLIFLAPTAYVALVWTALSTQIIGGGPFAWLTRASDQGQGPLLRHARITDLAGDVVSLTAQISPALWLVPLGLLVLAVVRRDGFAAWLAALVLLGAAVTLVLVLGRPQSGLLQPRYNVRSLPAVVLGAGWLIRSVAGGPPRRLVGAAILASFAAAIILAFSLMEHYPYQFAERAWAYGIVHGHGEPGAPAASGHPAGLQVDRRLADFLNRHVHRDKAVLIDDAAFPVVVLLSRHPAHFVTRIDAGDGRWLALARHPWGRVEYLVVANPDRTAANFSSDRLLGVWPHGFDGAVPHAHVVARTPLAAILAVDARPPLLDVLDGLRQRMLRGAGRVDRLTANPPTAAGSATRRRT